MYTSQFPRSPKAMVIPYQNQIAPCATYICLNKCIYFCKFSVVDEALEEVVDHIVHEVIKQGYLVKKGHKMRSMKERWCVLKPGNLAYYTNSNCSEKKGVIVINKSSSVESMAVKGKYRFSIKCGESETHYEMEAKDQKSRQEWIACIQAVIGEKIRGMLLNFTEM